VASSISPIDPSVASTSNPSMFVGFVTVDW
jgi:hypothetical protein